MSNWSHSSLRASSDRPYSRRMCSASCLRPSRTADGGHGAAAEQPPGRAEQVLDQLALPRIPHLRARAADVGDRQQVQRDQPALGLHHVGEAADHRFVGEVLLLRDLRHRQVVLHQERDEVGVVSVQPVLAAEATGIPRAELAVVAAAPLGDVVEERRDVQQPRLVEVGDQLAAQRVLVRVLGEREAAQVAQHLDDVLVDGVDVEQVVLHLADDAAEHGQVAAEHRQLVHPAQLVQHALRLLQQFEEGRAVARVAAVRAVDASRARATAPASAAATCP